MGLMSWAKRKMARGNLRALVEGRHHDQNEQATFDSIVAASVNGCPDDPAAIREGIQRGFWRIFGPGPDVTFSPGELLDAATTMAKRMSPRMFGTDREEQKQRKFTELDQQYPACNKEFLNNLKAPWLVSRGNYYGERKMLDEALEDFDEAVRLKSDLLAAHISRALVYANKGDLVRARQLAAEIPDEMKIDGTIVARKSDVAAFLSQING